MSLRLVDSGTELWLDPIGAGQPRRLTPAGLHPGTAGQFFADGKRIAYIASERNGRNRTYVQPLDGGAPRAISTESVAGALISPDQKWIAATGPAGAVLVPVDGGATVPIQGMQAGDSIRGWTTDSELFVANGPQPVLRIDRLDPRSGKRTSWRQMPAPAIVGVRIGAPFITPDGSSFTYGYSLSSSDLYVVTGVR